jgi:hypothetical protein
MSRVPSTSRPCADPPGAGVVELRVGQARGLAAQSIDHGRAAAAQAGTLELDVAGRTGLPRRLVDLQLRQAQLEAALGLAEHDPVVEVPHALALGSRAVPARGVDHEGLARLAVDFEVADALEVQVAARALFEVLDVAGHAAAIALVLDEPDLRGAGSLGRALASASRVQRGARHPAHVQHAARTHEQQRQEDPQ